MTRVLQRTKTSTGSKGIDREVAKACFGILVVAALVIGAISFASLAVGITKAILMILA